MSRKSQTNDTSDVKARNQRKEVVETKVPFGSDLDFASREAYNVLRTNLALSLPSRKRGKIIGITSSSPHEGKSYTSVNLAYVFAQNGDKTLLISGDMRKPTVEGYFGIQLTPGLSNLLVGSMEAEDIRNVIHSMTDLSEDLSVMPAGDIPPNPSELLGSHNMKALLDTLAGMYDYVLIDLPPVISVVDPVALSPCLDGMAVVVHYGITRKKNVVQAMKQLRFANVHILGFVYNGYSRHSGYYYRRRNKNASKEYSGPYGYNTYDTKGKSASDTGGTKR